MAARFVRLSFVVALFCLHFPLAPFARAEFITSFQSAYQGNTPAAGWEYLWNKNGEIGNPANYAALVAAPGNYYTSDGTTTFPTTPPAGFVNFGFDGNPSVPAGHPGLGQFEAGSLGIERYAIASYTLSVAGEIAVANGRVRTLNPNFGGSSDGVNLKIFVNNNPTPFLSTATPPGTGGQATFVKNLGNLAIGDKIYVAIGSKDTALRDSFALEYDIVIVPEPASISLALLVGLAMLVRRGARNR